MRLFFTALFLAAISAASGASASLPATYNEADGGDLPGNESALPVFAFDVGTNSITGHLGISEDAYDWDSFAFTVPEGARLASGQVEMTDDQGDLTHSVWSFYSGGANWYEGQFLGFFTATSTGVTEWTFPVGPGLYNVSASGYGAIGHPATADYTFAFAVVPEPGASSIIAALVAPLLCRLWSPADPFGGDEPRRCR